MVLETDADLTFNTVPHINDYIPIHQTINISRPHFACFVVSHVNKHMNSHLFFSQLGHSTCV